MPDRKPSPRQGKGERVFDCTHYSDCLDLAAREDWKSFHCEDCKDSEETTLMSEASTETVKICKECNEKPVISPHSDYCASCMARRSNKARAYGKPHKPRKPGKATRKQHESTKALREPNTAVTVDFGKYASVLQEVQDLAEKEMRPVDLQVIYMLKRCLEDKQHLVKVL